MKKSKKLISILLSLSMLTATVGALEINQEVTLTPISTVESQLSDFLLNQIGDTVEQAVAIKETPVEATPSGDAGLMNTDPIEEEIKNNELTLELNDGRNVWYSFSEDIKYTDQNGTTQYKDTTIVPQTDLALNIAGYTYTNGTNDFRINFSPNINKGVFTEDEGFKIGFVPVPNSETYAEAGSKTTFLQDGDPVDSFEYPNVYGNGTVLRYTAQLNTLKKDIILPSYRPHLRVTYHNLSLTTIPNGVYYIRNQNSGKYMDVASQNMASNANVHQWSFHGGLSQQWKLTNIGNGWYNIQPLQATHLGLDVRGPATTDGTNIQLYTFHGGNAQRFGFIAVGNGAYRMVTAVTSGEKGLSVNGRYTTDGANIHQWTYNPNYTNDHWFLEKATIIGGASNYRQDNSRSANCLGYALEINEWPVFAMYSDDTVYTVYDRLEILIEDTMNRNCRKLNTKDDFIHPTREYKIAMRIGIEWTLLGYNYDYHFMVQTNTGGWAHKQGECNSRNMGSIDPSTYDWKKPTSCDSNYNVVTEESFYNSDTIYFVVTR